MRRWRRAMAAAWLAMAAAVAPIPPGDPLAASTGERQATTPAPAPTNTSVTPAHPTPAGGAPAPKVGMFTITSRSGFYPIPSHLQLLDFWLPMPFQDEHQKIYQRVLGVPYQAETTELPDSMGMVAYMKGAPRGGVPLAVRITYHVERFEVLRPDLSAAKDKPVDEQERKIHERWLKPNALVVLDQDVRSRASKIVSRKKGVVDRARAIYDHVVANIGDANPYQVKGAGYGDLKFTLREMKGDEADISTAFVGLCRSLGIPARTVIGLRIPPERPGIKQGRINGDHCWAEFYVDGVGWVAVDPAAARNDRTRQDYYFGSLDERRVAISVGRDVVLAPPQVGPPLNFWSRAYWEGDQKPMSSPYVEVDYFELTEIPGKPLPPAAATPAAPAPAEQVTEPAEPVGPMPPERKPAPSKPPR